MKRFARFLLIVTSLGCCVSSAQNPPAPFLLNVNSDLMELHVTVVNDKNQPVRNLTRENFKIRENGIEQPISEFKHEDIPVSLGLVIDNSRSIEPRKARLDAATLSFVRQSNPEDETFVVHFDFDARLERDFTTSLPDLEATLAASKPFGQTAIYDALMLSLDQMQKARHSKKALLLVTDGLDNVSTTTFEQALDAVKRSRVTVIVVGLLSASEGAKAEETLTKIAEASGGKAYFPEDETQARTVMENAARELRTQYTISYVPTDPSHDGTWRSVRVEVLPPAGSKDRLEADYRHGYYRPDR